MANRILTIAPYRDEATSTWVFDDARVGLVAEPFVAGIPEMINSLVREIPEARRGFRLLFSAHPFPGYQRRLRRIDEEFEGYWYAGDDPPGKGWLCPALFCYFDVAPPELYVKAEPARSVAM